MGSSNPLRGEDRVERPPEVVHLPEDAPRIRHRPRRRNLRPRFVPLKILLGGIVGLMLGQLLLWWLPRPFRRDPFRLAPRLPAAVSFLAPASLRPMPRTAQRPPALGGGEDASDPPSGASGGLANTSSLAELAAEAPAEPEDDERQVGLTGVPLLRMHSLESSFNYSRRSHEAFVASDDWSSSAIESWYAALCSLAHDVTFADVRESNISAFADKTRTFFVRVAEDPRRRRAIEDAATTWIADVGNHRKGVVLAGRVTGIFPQAEIFRTELSWQGNSVHVMSRVDPRNNARVTFAEGDHVLILGVLVTQPSLYLLGYHGDADVVVWGGMPVRLASVGPAVR